ncbi:hypothetical protein L1987_64134 [Smallanthus sonchifolius]|uniref:Uncharacterized protein n=1 Tax=Smallanthus sonchifolius TaxID=185202 RepID=A0ACB9CF83_9ASTR|nr:hypothetical protein L1987_64134 [Smallanthus sonchifolius]
MSKICDKTDRNSVLLSGLSYLHPIIPHFSLASHFALAWGEERGDDHEGSSVGLLGLLLLTLSYLHPIPLFSPASPLALAWDEERGDDHGGSVVFGVCRFGPSVLGNPRWR